MIDRKSVRCQNCGKPSEHTVLLSTNACGSSDLDLRPPEMQRSTMDTWLQLCPNCGYCAPDISQPPTDSAVLRSQAYRAALQREDFPELARRFLAYAIAADPSEPAVVAHSYLRAAWVCDDVGRLDQAVESRQQAAEWFRKCKPFPDDEQGLTTGAVLVDVLRRCGQFAEAYSECAALISARNATGILRKVLEFQQQLIAQADRGTYTVADCDK